MDEWLSCKAFQSLFPENSAHSCETRHQLLLELSTFLFVLEISKKTVAQMMKRVKSVIEF